MGRRIQQVGAFVLLVSYLPFLAALSLIIHLYSQGSAIELRPARKFEGCVWKFRRTGPEWLNELIGKYALDALPGLWGAVLGEIRLSDLLKEYRINN